MSTPAQRLALSRQAIAEHLRRKDHRRGESQPRGEGSPTSDEGAPAGGKRGRGWFGSVSQAVKTWWKYHPAHLAVEVATPTLAHYARTKPVHLLAICAGIGAVAAVARPWRLISATGLAVALFKSSQLPNMLMSLLATHDFDEYEPPPEQRAGDPAQPPPH